MKSDDLESQSSSDEESLGTNQDLFSNTMSSFSQLIGLIPEIQGLTFLIKKYRQAYVDQYLGTSEMLPGDFDFVLDYTKVSSIELAERGIQICQNLGIDLGPSSNLDSLDMISRLPIVLDHINILKYTDSNIENIRTRMAKHLVQLAVNIKQGSHPKKNSG